MPIVRHVIELGPVQANGGRNVTVRYYDQDSVEYTEGFYADANYDVDAKANARVVSLSEQLATDEFNALVGL